MELNWSTFLLEVLNFLVLVWVLKRFLYKPVLDTIAKRKAGIEQALAAAQASKAETEVLQARYESRLSQWSEEREAARESLRREISDERERLMAILEQDLEKEREKETVLDDKHRADVLRKCQETSLVHGSRFVSRLLSDLACPELETRLVDMALKQLSELQDEQLNAVRLAWEENSEEADIFTAFPLDTARREKLSEILGSLVGKPAAARFNEEPELLAGLRVTLGPWVFQANLRDELRSFSAAANESD